MKKGIPILVVLTIVLAVTAYQDVHEEMNVNLVEIEVKAQDLTGAFIPNLTRDDFTVKENGKIQEIDKVREISPDTQPQNELVEDKSRIMLLLDLKNTSYPIMKKVFPELREYVQTLYDGKSEIGLALFSNGVIEVTGFTRDQEALFEGIDEAEAFYAKHKFRGYGRPSAPGPSSEEVNPLHEGSSFFRGFLSNYYRSDEDVLGQYIRYLGAYSGKKDLIVISERFILPGGPGEGDVDQEGIITLRDIQTICMYNKITINVITLARSVDYYGNDPLNLSRAGQKNRTGFFNDPGANMAAATSGYFFKIPQRKMDQFVGHAINKVGHYYRIRYYSKSGSFRFRHIKVSLKGTGRIARNLGGYYPRKGNITQEAASARLSLDRDYRFNLSLDTDWMYWAWNGWKKRTARFVVAQRAFDGEGNLMAEQVFTGLLFKKKKSGSWPKVQLEKELVLGISDRALPTRLETTILDLISGRKVFFQQDGPFG